MTAQQKIVQEAMERFPNLGNRTLAKYILHNYGDVFGNDLERVRSKVRYRRGALGEKNRRWETMAIGSTPSPGRRLTNDSQKHCRRTRLCNRQVGSVLLLTAYRLPRTMGRNGNGSITKPPTTRCCPRRTVAESAKK